MVEPGRHRHSLITRREGCLCDTGTRCSERLGFQKYPGNVPKISSVLPASRTKKLFLNVAWRVVESASLNLSLK
jgi:hypothetical protein